MKCDETYNRYQHFKEHIEKKVLPRHKEWSIKERIENSLPNHNQNTSKYVEYSFRVTKEIQFSRLRAYNLVDLLSVCLDDSKFYTRRCTDVSHNRNYHLFTNQKSKYLFKTTKLNSSQIIKLSRSEYLVPSENIEDRLYKVNTDQRTCECKQGASKGPCKHKSLVVNKFQLKNFEVLPKDNPEMRSVYYYLATGENKDPAWFRPIDKEESVVPLVDWEENIENPQDDQISNESIEHMDVDESTQNSSESNEFDFDNSGDVLSDFKKSIFNLLVKVEDRFNKDKLNYESALKAFIKQEGKLNGDTSIQKSLHTFAKDVVNAVKKGRKKNSGTIPVQNTAKARRTYKHRGAEPSQMGRPSKETSRTQMIVEQEEEILAHSIPNRSKKKTKYPHNLSAAVADNRAGEKKH